MPNIMEGYRNLPIIIDNSLWWFADIMYGF